MAGLQTQPYKYCTSWVFEMSLWMIALTCCWLVIDLAGGENLVGRSGSRMSHKQPSVGLRVPFKMHFLFLKTWRCFLLSRTAMQLSSHNCPIEMSDELVIPSTIWAVLETVLNLWLNGRMPLCVAWILLLSGSMTVGPYGVGHRSCSTCASAVRI